MIRHASLSNNAKIWIEYAEKPALESSKLNNSEIYRFSLGDTFGNIRKLVL